MKKSITIALLILLFVITLSCAKEAGKEWETLNQEVIELYQQGKYDRAVIVAGQALEVAEANVGPDHPVVATSLNNLGLLYKAQGDYAKAEPLYRRSLAIKEKALDPDHPGVATSLENIAVMYRATNRNNEALTFEKRAKQIRAFKR